MYDNVYGIGFSVWGLGEEGWETIQVHQAIGSLVLIIDKALGIEPCRVVI
jgi:hypothetical protein